jgi:hypothetical protein
MVDLQDNALILSSAGPSSIGRVESLVRSARNGGTWDGPGVTSSAARDNPQRNTMLGVMEASEYKAILNDPDATFAGEAIDDTAVLVKYTYYGDANFDGAVNVDDYVRIDTGFNTHRTGWSNGDFNHSGSVNFDDYVLIDTAFNTQGTPSGTFSLSSDRAARDRLPVSVHATGARRHDVSSPPRDR